MANTLERQITLDGYRNVVVKLTGVIDTSDVIVMPALSLSDLVTNEQRLTLWGLRANAVTWSLSDGLEIAIEWNGTVPQQMWQLSGRGKACADGYGGYNPDPLRTGYDGSINLRTMAYGAGTISNYMVLLEFVKLYR